MNRIICFLRGEARIHLTGASPEGCLNRLTQEGIPFWDIARIDELHIDISVLRRDKKRINEAALRSFCTAELISERGLLHLLAPLRKRPVLTLGIPLLIAASFFLQSFVWVVEVEGEETLHEEEILHELESLGIRFGTQAAEINSQKIKMQMLNALPQLSWLAVNRTGGKLTVLVTERESTSSSKQPYATGSLIAASDGIITDYTILEGMRLCSRGDAVRQGQILVSGYEDNGLFLRGVCADGEIYARTWHRGTLVMPSTRLVKRYTGREWTQRTLIVGRKRINLCGNSGIYTDSCDKMIIEERVILPDYEFPLALETAIYREYETVEVERDREEVRQQMEAAWKQLTLSGMVAGQMEKTKSSLLCVDGLYVLQAESTCNEMIARLVPIVEPYKGENNE